MSDSVPLDEVPAAAGKEAVRFDVFLSHNSRDKPLVERLAEKLQRARVEPWLDAWCLVPGADWQRGLAEGLAASRSCAVFVGPADLGAWTYQEVGVALDRAANDPDFRLFLVLLPGLPEQFDSTTLPPFLRLRTWVDYRRGLDDERAFHALVSAVNGLPLGPGVPLTPDTDVCPYRGLEAFDEEHAEFFFGRDADVQRLLEKSKGTRFLAVLGASGSGKSSLVRAGLVPALKHGAADAGQWLIVIMRPGAHPLEALAAHLLQIGGGSMQETLDALAADQRTLHLASSLALVDRPPGTRLLIAVDQFEEVFTLCRDERERAAFFANLLYAATIPDGGSRILLAMRSDFYHRCGAYPELAQQLAADQHVVSPLQPAGLRQAIEEPARRVGLVFESGLVPTILDDVAEQPGALPLLEHALLELWQRRTGGMLTLTGYRDSGGVEGAIAKRAEEVFASLAPEQQELARRAFLRLTQPGEGTEDTRRRAQLTELATGGAQAGVGSVLARLVDARLVTTSRDETAGAEVVEVAHEALIRGWPRLRGWVDEDRAGLRVHRRLTEAAGEWERLSRDESALLRGARLAEALEWRDDNEESLNDLERAFLGASTTAEQRELERARRRTRALRALAATLAVLLVAAVAAAVLAKRQTDEANAQRDEATAQRELVLSRALATKAVESLSSSPDLAVLLGLEALEVVSDHPLEGRFAARDAMLRALQRNPRLQAVLHAPGAGVAVSADGGLLAAAGVDEKIRLWDLDARRLVAPPLAAGSSALAVAFAADGQSVAAVTEDGARLWDVRDTGEPRTLGAGQTFDVAFSSNGLVATAGNGVQLWNARSGKPVRRLLGGVFSAVGLAFSPDGRALAAATPTGTALVWDTTRPEQSARTLRTSEGRGPYMPSTVAFSADGRRLVAAGTDGDVRLWSFPELEPLRTLRLGKALHGHEDLGVTFYPEVAFSPDARTVAVGDYDGVIRLWDLDGRPRVRETLRGHTENVVGLAFTPDGRTLVSSGADDTIRIWDVRPEAPLSVTLQGDVGQVSALAFSPDGRRLAAGGDDLRLWDVRRRTLDRVLQRTPTSDALAFSPDGGTLASSSGKTVQFWDMASRKPRARTLVNPSEISDVAFSTDGQTFAAADYDAVVRLWNVADLRPRDDTLRHAGRPPGMLVRIEFSPDGRTLASAAEDVRLWDVERRPTLGERLRVAETGVGVSAQGPIAFGAGGRLLASVEYPSQVRLWDVESRRALGNPLTAGLRTPSSLAFSADGQTLAVPGDDGAVLLWDADSREQVGEPLRGHVGEVVAVAFDPAGGTLASASADLEGSPADESIRLWDSILFRTDVDAWRRRLCPVVRRSMTETEWREAMPGVPYGRTCARFGAPPPQHPRPGP